MNTPVKERPILFSSAMVRALLNGTKTQTRRVMKQQPPACWVPDTTSPTFSQILQLCPYGQPVGLGRELQTPDPMTYHPHINTAAYSIPMLEARLKELEYAERHSTRRSAPRQTEMRAIRAALNKRTATTKPTTSCTTLPDKSQ